MVQTSQRTANSAAAAERTQLPNHGPQTKASKARGDDVVDDPRSSVLFNDDLLNRLEYLNLVARKIFAGHEAAKRRTKKLGPGIEFADHRDYVPGDDYRYIDWNAAGRSSRLLLRLFEEQQDLCLYILLDVSRSMGLPPPTGSTVPKLHCGIQLTAALAYIALSDLDRVGIAAVSDGINAFFPPARGKNHIFKVLDFLSELTCSGVTQLGQATKSFVHQTRRRGPTVLISDYYDISGYRQALRLLKHHGFDPCAIQLYDANDANPPTLGDATLSDAETGATIDLTISKATHTALELEHQRFCGNLADFCLDKHIPLFLANTQLPFDEVVLALLRCGGILR